VNTTKNASESEIFHSLLM